MHLIAQAEAALARNWPTLLWYTLASLAVLSAHGLLLDAVGNGVPSETGPKPLWAVLATLGLDLLLVALIAALQSVAFGLIGGEMDRPLWKFGAPQESLRRFFSYWFILNLLSITFARLPGSVPESAQMDVGLIMEVLRFQLIILGAPFGACIMHGGGLHWKEIPALLGPCFRLFPQAAIAMALGVFQCFVIMIAVGAAPEAMRGSVWYWTAVSLPLILLEALAFAVMWLVCIQYREVAAETQDDDFDF